MNKIIIAPDSFKGSLTAKEVCNATEEGIRKVNRDIDIIKIPMADGGEGTVQSLVDCKNGKIIYKEVVNPLGETIEASIGVLDKETAVIEMASASGLPLIPKDKRNPLITTTFGTGQLIKHGLDLGIKKYNVPVIILTGTIEDNIDRIYDLGVTSVFSIVKGPISVEYAMENAYALIKDTAERIMRLIETD